MFSCSLLICLDTEALYSWLFYQYLRGKPPESYSKIRVDTKFEQNKEKRKKR